MLALQSSRGQFFFPQWIHWVHADVSKRDVAGTNQLQAFKRFERAGWGRDKQPKQHQNAGFNGASRK